MTYLFSDDIAAIVSQPHGQTFSAVAILADATRVNLDVEAGTVGWDETRAPRVGTNLTCKIPDDIDVLTAIDPRLGVRLELTAGYVRPGGSKESAVIANLGLRKRNVRRNENESSMILEASSDEALVIDNSEVYGGTVSGSSVPLAMQALVNQALNPDPTSFTITHTDKTATSEVDIADRWQTIDDLADQIEADIYDDGLRNWYITPRPVKASTSVAALKVGENGTILDSDSMLERDNWANQVKLRYKWTDASNVDHTVIGTATATGTFAPSATIPTRLFTQDRESPTTTTKANQSAAALLKRYLARGRSYALTSVAMWWVRPGDTVTVQLPTGDQERHLVASVSFNPRDFTMNVVTRLPDGISVIGE